MSQPNRKRRNWQSSPTVKEEQQEQEEAGTTHSFGARINGNASQCSSSNLEDGNTNNIAGGGNGVDDINELKMKMAALEAKNQILEGKLENQELRAQLHAMSETKILVNLKQENRALWMRLNEVEANGQAENKKIMDELKRLTALEAKHQQEILGLKATNERKQLQQRPTAKMSVCAVNMPESHGTSNNTNETQHSIVENRQQAKQPTAAALVPPPPKSIAHNLVLPRHSPKLPDCVNMLESNSQGNLDNFNDDEILRLRALESRHRKQATLALIPPPPPPPPKAVVLTPDPVLFHSANLPDSVNMQESYSHRNLDPLDERLHALEVLRRQQAIMAEVAALVPPPLKSILNPLPLPCHSAQPKVVEAKRLCNPEKNFWNKNTTKVTMKISLPEQLNVHNSSLQWGNIAARKGFLLLSWFRLQLQNDFAGPILYYYEITTTSSSKHNESRLCIGLSNGSVKKGTCLGRTENTYAMQDDKCDYCLLSGHEHFLEWPAGAVKPKWTGTGCEDVFGCGLVLSANNKLAIFFTTNGTLMGKQIAIDHHASSILYPTVCLNRDVTVEANFGQKPFKYNIGKCPGLQLQW